MEEKIEKNEARQERRKERENVFDVNIRDQHNNSNSDSRSAERAIIQAST